MRDDGPRHDVNMQRHHLGRLPGHSGESKLLVATWPGVAVPVPCDGLVSTLFFASLFSSSVFLFPLDGIDEDEEGHFVTMVVHYLPA